MYHRIHSGVFLLCAVVVPSYFQAQAAEHHSPKHLKALVHSAHSTLEYRLLSDHFHQEALKFDQLADTENKTLQQELVHPTRLKYPSSPDIAKRLRDYYAYRAEDATAKAAVYDKLLQPATSAN